MKRLYTLSVALLLTVYILGGVYFVGWLLETGKNLHDEPEDFYLSLPYLLPLLFALWTVGSQLFNALGYRATLSVGAEKTGHLVYLAIWLFFLVSVFQPSETGNNLFYWGTSEDLTIILVGLLAVAVHFAGLVRS